VNLIVQKFGGTSLASVEHIQNVAKKVLASKKAGKDVVVVVSAMAKETDRLLDLTSKISTDLISPEMDLVASTGETITCALLSMALQTLGQPARSFLGHEIPILTDNSVSQAQVLSLNPKKILESVGRGEIPVIAGFQGISGDGRITTLGRGGSDTTAVAVAAALGGVPCEIYTDVEGVYSADPKVCSEALLLPKVSYEFMIEAAGLGAKVMHDRSVRIGQMHHIPIQVKSTFLDTPGSLITDVENSARCVAITKYPHALGIAQVSLVGNTFFETQQNEILGLLKENNIQCLGTSTRKISWSCFVKQETAFSIARLLHAQFIWRFLYAISTPSDRNEKKTHDF
jgi:aspartate kinase